MTSVRIVEEFGSIDHEARRWALLADETNSPMNQYGWVKACSNAFAAYGKLQLIVIGMEAGQPGALGPLIMRGKHLNRMECLGVDELYEPTDFPHSDPASLQGPDSRSDRISPALAATSHFGKFACLDGACGSLQIARHTHHATSHLATPGSSLMRRGAIRKRNSVKAAVPACAELCAKRKKSDPFIFKSSHQNRMNSRRSWQRACA
jgi:hypothetical protein